jgi:glycosyltransferase involved in cell wall biosynthesis
MGSSMINIMHLTSSFGVSGGGAEGSLRRLVTHMDGSRFRNTLVTMMDVFDGSSKSLGSLLDQSKVRLHSLGMKRGVPNLSAAVRLGRIVRQSNPDVLMTWMYPADLLGLVVGRVTRVPSICWCLQCSALDGPGFGWMQKLVRRALVSLSSLPDVVMANSWAGLEFHRALGYRPPKLIYMPNTIDLDLFKPDERAGGWLRSELALPARARLIGVLARFHPMKDFQTFIRAASLLASENPDVHFVMAGIGVEETNSSIQKMVEASGAADRFHLLGARLDVNMIAAALDIACSSSAFGEGTSNSIAEAMACGVPCVATDVGDAGFMIHNTGRVVPPKDPKSIARACHELLELSLEERRQLGLSARERMAELFSLSTVVPRYEELYEQLAWTAKANSHGMNGRTSLNQAD